MEAIMRTSITRLIIAAAVATRDVVIAAVVARLCYRLA
jgi:hypothetical protein